MIFLPGGLTFWLHVLIQVFFGMKTFFAKGLIIILLLGTAITATATNFTLPGEVWGRFDVTQHNGNIAQGDIQQGIKFKRFPFLIPYVGVTHYSIVNGDSESYIKYGIKTDLLKPITIGIEKQHYIYSNPELPDNLTGYISLYKDWELLK